LQVNAKINLSLNVAGKAHNGYHCLDMVMASVNLFDTVTVARRADKIVTVAMADARGVPIDVKPELNTAYKAASMLSSGFGLSGCDISIVKGIPLAGGLGGSSADAAGAIYALSKLHNIDVKSSGAYLIAFRSGSDVPYMLDGGYAHVYGRGEKINMIACRHKFHLVIAKGKAGCSTWEAYAAFDKLGKTRGSGTAQILRALTETDPLKSGAAGAAPYLQNDLQEASISLCPEIAATLELLQSTAPLCALMSGSGSACFAVYASAEDSRRAYAQIKDKTDFCAVCETVPRGITEV
jgi:4-diphosphocytidyl-2-C-methyl-D-erythritol kinase